MERKGGLLLVFVVLALSAATANATIVTIGLRGEVTYVDEYSEGLNQLFDVGDPVQGIYIYDSDTPDSSLLEDVGGYRYSSPPYGISLDVGGIILQTDPYNVDFLMSILNNHTGMDGYALRSYNNLALSNDVPVWHISWQLWDYSCNAVSSTELPTSPPVLENWGQDSLMIEFGYKGGATLGVEVTSVELVPEPSTILLLSLASFALLNKRKKESKY